MKLLTSLLLIVLFCLGCEKRSPVPNVELTQDMFKDPSFKAQDFDSDKKDKISNRVPPEGTVPHGWTPYPANYVSDMDAKNYPNPTKATTEMLAKGERKYQIYCGVCHGSKGDGHGTIVDKMLVKPPTLVDQKIKGWTDGQIFHLITKGRGMMGSYESQIPSMEDRWAVVHYIRHLQKNQKANNGASNGTNNN